MKILLIPLGWDKPHEHKSLVDAFRNAGHEAVLFTSVESGILFRPEIVFYQGGLDYNECMRLGYKTEHEQKWITWTGDIRYAPQQSLIECKEFTDEYLLPCCGEILETYEYLLGNPCRYIWEYFPTHRMREPQELNDGSITFVGNVYDCVPGGSERIDIAELLSRSFGNKFQAFGSFPENEVSNLKGQVNVEQVPDIYRNSFITIANNNWSDIEGYFTPRNLQAMSDSCAVMKWFPGIEDHFTSWEDCVVYKHKYELLDIITYLYLNPAKRNEIAKAGYKLVKENYSIDSWVKRFIEIL